MNESNETWEPLADRVLIEEAEAIEKTAGGIVLPDASKEKPLAGTVIAVGPGKLNDAGGYQPMHVKPGQIVYFAKYSGVKIRLAGKEYIVMREVDVLLKKKDE